MSTVKFEEKAVKEYLDKMIIFWRKNKKFAEEGVADSVYQDVDQRILIATCYRDAFQSVRISLFGEVLPIQMEGE